MNTPTDGVAIVGMAGRFPGAASIDEFWRNLIFGQESITHFKREQLSPLVTELAADPHYVAARGVIADADLFDAAFFGIASSEALLMDPQQRVFLELCWNALEHAGIDTQRFAGSIGVYAGVSNNSYRKLVEMHPELTAASGEFATMLANEKDYVATRVAHRIGLTGPAISLYTACSTSLVAVAQAWYALMSWQCDAALAGGINIVVPQESGYLSIDGGMESTDGHCRPFDADSSGTVFSSGGGVVVLKRLADAIAARDTIWAVIRGVGVNNDGADKASFTAPSARGQSAAIQLALSTAGVSADSIQYIEAHGTATALGDPIEVEALTRAFGAHTDARQFCWLGSVKSNLGHLVAGSGVAGLIKAALALHHGQIPPTLHYRRPNPEIDFAQTPFKVASRAVPWPRSEQPRRAGVSSFGVGGTNAHVVIEEAPERAANAAAPKLPVVLPLSARDDDGLLHRAEDLAAALSSYGDADLPDIAWSLATGRRAMRTRGAVVAASIAEAQQRLHALAAQHATDAPRIVFLFPGQGSQYAGMARPVLEAEPEFAAAFERCCELASPLIGRDLRALIMPEPDAQNSANLLLAETRYAQPALFAVEYALAQLWHHWGVEPAAMIGHSVGEYVAACLAGVFSVDVAMRLVVARAAAMDAQSRGAMLAVRSGESDVITRLSKGIEVAAINAPDSTVVAGSVDDIDEFARQLEAAHIASTRLHVSHAFHCALMDAALPVFRRAFDDVKLDAPCIPFYSCVTGQPVAEDDAKSPDYWCRQIRAPVFFAQAAAHALDDPGSVALEVGPGQALTNLLRRGPQWRERVVPSLGSARRNGDNMHLAAAAGALWSAGAQVDWDRVLGAAERRRVPLPGYPFRGPRYWLETPNAVAGPRPPEPSVQLAEPASPVVAKVLQQAVARVPGSTSELPAETASTRVRAELRELFSSLSGERIDAAQDTASFVQLGLDSLALTQAALEIERRYGLKMKFRRLMEDADSVAKLAAAIEPKLDGDGPASQVSASAAPPPSTSPAAAAPPPAIDVAAEASAQPFGAAARITVRSSAEFNARQREWVSAFISRYAQRTAKSKQFSQQHRAPMADPRVVTGFNPLWKELVYPIVVDRSSGARLWDLDGHEYLDLLNAFGANFLGYQPELVKHALARQIEAGFEIGPQHPLTAEVTQLICEMTGSERVAFCNTGSEAVMGAMRIARTVTGRKTIVIFRDSYHGIFDEVIVRGTRQLRSIAAAPGILANAVENILVLEYGSDEALAVIRERARDLAAVMIEPVQARNPALQPHRFVQELRAICDAGGCALIFDEVITGFRVSPGGAQEFYGVRADLATYGKVIGGGLPFAVIAGKSSWMDALDGGQWQFGDDSRPEAGVTYFAGTFVRHPLALAAAKATLLHLRELGPQLQRGLNERTRALVARLNAFFDVQRAPLHAIGFSSLWRIRVDADQPFAELFFYALRERGLHVYAQFNCFLTAAHGATEVDEIVARIEAATRELLEAEVLSRRSGAAQPIAETAGPSPVRAEAVPLDPSAACAPEAADDADVFVADRQASSRPVAAALPSEVPLTDAQAEKWIACQFGESANVAFNESQLLMLHGNLDRSALEQAIARVCVRHEAFGTSYAADGSVLRVEPAAPVVPKFLELTDTPGGRSRPSMASAGPSRPSMASGALGLLPGALGLGESLRNHCAVAVREPFDLTRAPLMRIELIRLGPEDHALLVVAHHLIFDSWSAMVFFDEVAAVYRALVAGTPVSLPEPQSFRAFALEERNRRTGVAARTQLQHWMRVYAGMPDALDLPADRPRPMQPQFAADTVFHDFPDEQSRAIRQLARSSEATLYVTLLSAFAVLLARLSGQSEFSIGIPFASQAPAGRNAMLGDGVNTLPLRLRVDPDETFAALVRRVHAALLDAADNQDVTLYTLLNALGHRQRAERGTLADVIFNFNPPVALPDFAGVACTMRDCAKAALVKDLFFNLSDDGERLTLDIHYRTAFFDPATIERWIGHYQAILADVTARADRPVSELRILDAAQERTLLHEHNATVRDFALDTTVAALVAKQAQRTPDRVAVECEGRTLTYGELMRLANAVARSLAARGIGRGEIVGVCLPRGVEMVAALIGVQACGAAYTPLDLRYPAARLQRVIGHAQVRHVVALDEAAGAFGPDCSVHAFDALLSADATAELAPASGAAPAYVLYTSGSTGEPKGVRVLQRNLVNVLLSMRERPGLGADDVLCAVTTLSFDIAGLELYLPLLTGARVLIATEEDHRDPDALIRLMRERGATVLQTTPSWLRVLVSNGRARNLPRLKLLIGGEELPRDLAESVLPHCAELWNMYGPTETTIWSTAARVESGAGAVPIGTPVANTRIYILDAQRQLAPPGTRGEIWIAGAGVADGYLHQPELSAERFQPDPFFGAGERMYRTGDVGSWSGGQLAYHGRVDTQFKLRGFRIEPGDIEAAALAEPGVTAAAATVFALSDTDRRLALYVVAPGAGAEFGQELRNRLRQRLPPHFVPQHVDVLEHLPQTEHGKIDRNALPRPSVLDAPKEETELVTADGMDDLTRALLGIWRDLLGVADAGVDGNFFDLGGDSLLGVELFQRAHAITGVNLPLSTLLTAQTVREQAELFRSAGAALDHDHPSKVLHSAPQPAEDKWSPLVTIQAAGSRPPLFCVHALGGNVLNYGPLARALGPDQPVYGLQAVGLDGITPPLLTVEAMAQRYLREIRGHSPHGPYYLCGGSMGGSIAFEIAQLLSAAGESVPFLGLFDTYGPGNSLEELAHGGSIAQMSYRWRDRWARVRKFDADARRAMLSAALHRRVDRSMDAMRSAWYHWRGTALPHGVRYRELERIHLRADEGYRPRPYFGPVTLFRAMEQPERLRDSWALGWEAVLCGGIQVVDLPGTHDTLIEQPLLARALHDALELAFISVRMEPGDRIRRAG